MCFDQEGEKMERERGEEASRRGQGAVGKGGGAGARQGGNEIRGRVRRSPMTF